MKKSIIALCLCVCMLAGACLGESADVNYIEWLAEGKYQELFDVMTPEMQETVTSPDMISAIWAPLIRLFGDYIGMRVIGETEQGVYKITSVSCEFATAHATLNIVINEQGLLAGLSIQNVENKPPEIEVTDEYTEEDILLRAGEADETKGLLTVPSGEGPFPCAVLLHGSGPSDMNATAYGIHVFARLARALAQNGVASLRYDKYTYAHPENCMSADFTVDNEYLPDAQAALALLEADARFDRTFVIGHSLGAMIAPRVIANIEGADKLRGAVLIAGTPMHLWQIIEYQNRDAIALADISEDEKAAALAALEAELAALKDACELGDDMRDAMAFGLYAYYLYDEARVDAAQIAKELGLPLMIIQGGKDFQVPVDMGLEAWRAELSEVEGVEYALYPDMTHLLFDLEGESTRGVGDYAGEHEQNAQLAADIANWIAAIK